MNRRAKNKRVDVIGVGNNATDTIIRLPYFPVSDSKTEVTSVELKLGGQVASALVACQRWGLRTRYIGKIGDDAAGKLQMREMAREGVASHWIRTSNCTSQTSFILVDEKTGERTVLWKRDPAIALTPSDFRRKWLAPGRMLLVDGHDTAAAIQAARWAHEEDIPIVGDFDNLYTGTNVLLKYIHFPVTSKGFPERFTGEVDILKSLPIIFSKSKCYLIVTTLGHLGALAWDGENFYLSRGFKIRAIDTTGAGDIFHAGFLYGLLQKWTYKHILEFSCAAAALNCMSQGARGGIATVEEIDKFRLTANRSERAYTSKRLLEAARLASGHEPKVRLLSPQCADTGPRIASKTTRAKSKKRPRGIDSRRKTS